MDTSAPPVGITAEDWAATPVAVQQVLLATLTVVTLQQQQIAQLLAAWPIWKRASTSIRRIRPNHRRLTRPRHRPGRPAFHAGGNLAGKPGIRITNGPIPIPIRSPRPTTTFRPPVRPAAMT
jgi:hypothetical protein